MYLLRLLRRSLPRGRDRRNAHSRVPHGKPRREHHDEGQAAGDRREIRGYDRRRQSGRRTVPIATMSIVQFLFYAFAAVLVISAIGVITARNPVHAVLFLVFAFFTSAVIWMLMEAEFLAIVLALVYVGAVMVLFLFVVMMLDINVAQLREGFTRYAPLGIVIAIVVVAEIGSVVWVKSLGLVIGERARMPQAVSNTQALGHMLYTDYLYPLE